MTETFNTEGVAWLKDGKLPEMPDRLTIDGVPYVRVATSDAVRPPTSAPGTPSACIGVAITTHNRHDVLKRCLNALFEHGYPGPIVVVDDASRDPAETQLSDLTKSLITIVRREPNIGIARAKNLCIEKLLELGCEHLFLFDDDCWPQAPDWWKPYVDSDEPHLCYLFKDRGPRGVVQTTPRTTYEDTVMWAQEHPRGCMVYLHRSVVDRVGGYRPEFGRWGHEHVEYSRRIHAAGLTLQPFQDVVGSDELIYSMDADWHNNPKFQRSVPDRVRREELARNEQLLKQFEGTTDYVEYREIANRVLTACFNGAGDPQRKGAAPLSSEQFRTWRDSIKGGFPVVLHDILPGDKLLSLDDRSRGWKQVPAGKMNPYVQRWVAYYRFLRERPAKWVWCTDGTDVEMLREPWGEMREGIVYVGYEPTCVGTPWMANNHAPYRQWIDDHGELTLLNAGVAGGDYATMLEFTHDMAAECLRIDHSNLAGDMAAFNYVLRQPKWQDRYYYGPIVTTLFKANERNDWSWFKHK